MDKAVGIAEFQSIAKGIAMLDTMTKRANIRIIENKIVCSGKFFVVVAGEVADVEAAIGLLEGLPESELVGAQVISRLEDGVIDKINSKIDRDSITAIGVIETRNVYSGLYGANFIKKSSDVDILTIALTFGLGGKSLVVFTGDIASVRNGIEAAKANLEDPEDIVFDGAMASPSREVVENLFR